MQSKHLKLREIIWEITGECHNNCAYCGSKKVNDKKVSYETIINIAKEIAKYPPEEIDMSGGDPLVIPIATHKEVIDILKQVGVKCKILCNPRSVSTANSAVWETIKMYDWAGFSINTKEELKLMKKIFEPPFPSVNYSEHFQNYTIITNFNVLNLYDYDLIEEYVKKHNKLWTIQFTVYEDEENNLAIYNNESALKLLEDKINTSIQNGVKILLSDNTRNDLPCGAGFSSIGITYDGSVIPCLSMRSWCDPTKNKTPNILKGGLEKIWKEEFKQQRFGDFKCCKDACKNKIINLKLDPLKIDWETIKKQFDDIPKINEITPSFPGGISIYSVQMPPSTIMYAVQVMAYAVQSFPQNISLLYAVRQDTNSYSCPIAPPPDDGSEK